MNINIGFLPLHRKQPTYISDHLHHALLHASKTPTQTARTSWIDKRRSKPPTDAPAQSRCTNIWQSTRQPPSPNPNHGPNAGAGSTSRPSRIDQRRCKPQYDTPAQSKSTNHWQSTRQPTVADSNHRPYHSRILEAPYKGSTTKRQQSRTQPFSAESNPRQHLLRLLGSGGNCF